MSEGEGGGKNSRKPSTSVCVFNSHLKESHRNLDSETDDFANRILSHTGLKMKNGAHFFSEREIETILRERRTSYIIYCT